MSLNFLPWPSGSWTSTLECWIPDVFARSSTACGACWSRGPCRKREAVRPKRELLEAWLVQRLRMNECSRLLALPDGAVD